MPQIRERQDLRATKTHFYCPDWTDPLPPSTNWERKRSSRKVSASTETRLQMPCHDQRKKLFRALPPATVATAKKCSPCATWSLIVVQASIEHRLQKNRTLRTITTRILVAVPDGRLRRAEFQLPHPRLEFPRLHRICLHRLQFLGKIQGSFNRTQSFTITRQRF